MLCSRPLFSMFALLVAPLSVAASALAGNCDACEKAIVVGVGDTPFVGSATGCLLPGGGPDCALSSDNTNFFSFTPESSGLYRISTCIGATGNTLTVLSVRTGCGPSDTLECGLAGCPSGTSAGSQIGAINLEEGFTYIIGVGAFAEGVIESGTLSIDPIDAPGTGCASATVAVLGLNDYDTSNLNEIVDLEGACLTYPTGEGLDNRIYNTQYFRFTPPTTGVYRVWTCGLSEEQVWERIAILSGCSPTDGVIACSDNNCPWGDDYTGSEIIAVGLQGGVEYTILIGGVFASQAGVGKFSIAPFQPCIGPEPTLQEAEPCGADLNSGCLLPSNPAEPISLGDSVRGTYWAADGVRDTDWYRLDLAEDTEVKLELNARIPGFATFFTAQCTTSIFTDQTTGVCPGLTDGECLPAGQHFIVVVPLDFFNYPCGFLGGNEYTLTVTGQPCDASPPPNDDCADAIAAELGSTPFDNYYASMETELESCSLIGRDVWFTFTATETGDHKISTCNGPTPFNSAMDVWTGCPLKGGLQLACNRDSGDFACGDSSLSSVILPLSAGQTVHIRVGSEFVLFDFALPGETELLIEFIGEDAQCGDPDAGECCGAKATPFCSDMSCCNFICLLDWTCCSVAWDTACAASAALYCYESCGLPAENDDCANPKPALAGSNAFKNVRAEDSVETACGALYFDVWFEYTATGDGPVTISFCEEDGGWALITGNNGELDTRIAVFDFCGGNLIACNDDGCGVRSKVSFTPTCGARYLIAIGSADDDEGIYSQGVGAFRLTQGGSCGPACPADLNGDGEVAAQDLAALLSAWGESGGDLNGDGTTSAPDLAALLAAWGSCG